MPSEARKIVERLKVALGEETLAGIARSLELDPSVVNRVIRRNKVPESWLYKVAYQTRTNVDWLRTGQGPRSLVELLSADQELAPEVRCLISAWNCVTPDERAWLANQVKTIRQDAGPPEAAERALGMLENFGRIRFVLRIIKGQVSAKQYRDISEKLSDMFIWGYSGKAFPGNWELEVALEKISSGKKTATNKAAQASKSPPKRGQRVIRKLQPKKGK